MIIRRALRFFGHQDYLRFGVRDRVIRRLHDPDTAAAEEFTIPFFGRRYRGNFDTYIDWSAYYYGAYCREELRLMEEVLAPLREPVVFDVGANIGHHTLFASGCAAAVYSFEPLPAVYARLEQKIADNQLTNVTLGRYGLGAENALAPYQPPSGHNSGTGSFTAASDSARTLSLPIRRGDAVVKELGLTRLDFIKIDTEGYEPPVLAGLRETLAAFRPVVFFEWSQNARTAGAFPQTALFPGEYRFFQFVPDTVVLKFFRQPAYRLEPLAAAWADGNVLAVPREYAERVAREAPSSLIARRLAEAGG